MPEEARCVEPDVVPGEEWRLGIDLLVVRPPGRPPGRPRRVRALDRAVDGEAVVVTGAVEVGVELSSRPPVPAVDVAGEGASQPGPDAAVVAGVEEGVRPLVRA